MNLFEYKKDCINIDLKLFGIPLYKKRKTRNEKLVSILGNVFQYISGKPFEKIYKIAGIPIWQKIQYEDNEGWNQRISFLSSINIKEIIRTEVFDNILQEQRKEYKNVVIIRSTIGETYILQYFLKQYMQKYNLHPDDTCFVSFRSSFTDIFAMYNPQIVYKFLPNMDVKKLFYSIDDSFYKYNDINFHIFVNKKFIYNLVDEYKSNKSDKHCCDAVYDYFGVDREKLTPIKTIISADIEYRIAQKIKYLNLNLNKFVLFIPEANSISELPPEFWHTLEFEFKKRGYDVFYNVTRKDDYLNKNKFIPDLEELKYLGNKAKGIIGLSTGVIETLTRCNNNLFCIYTDFKLNNMAANEVMKYYSKKKFPFANEKLIHEFVYKNNDDELINKIMEKY